MVQTVNGRIVGPRVNPIGVCANEDCRAEFYLEPNDGKRFCSRACANLVKMTKKALALAVHHDRKSAREG